MRLHSTSLRDGEPVPQAYAFAVPDPEEHVKLAQNLSPHFEWEDLPAGTRSLVLICHDPDAPSSPEDVNKEDREVPADLPRVDFYHWVLINIDPKLGELREAEFSQGVVPKGKAGPQGAQHTRQGLNDYTNWFKGDKDMEGHYYGYDGPCPPWNDSIPHRYIFTLYATDLPEIPVHDVFTGPEVEEAMKGHILGEASITCTYTLNPKVKA